MPTLRATIKPGSKIVPHLWFVREAVEAANFYVSLFPDSHIDNVTPIPVDTPSGPAGSVEVVEFTLAGQRFMAISAGPLDPFNEMMRDTDSARARHVMEALLQMQKLDIAALEEA